MTQLAPARNQAREADHASPIAALLIAAAIGGAVSLSLGVYARIHQPTLQGMVTFGFPAVLPMKAWLTTAAATLAIGQMVSALWMWGNLPGAGNTARLDSVEPPVARHRRLRADTSGRLPLSVGPGISR